MVTLVFSLKEEKNVWIHLFWDQHTDSHIVGVREATKKRKKNFYRIIKKLYILDQPSIPTIAPGPPRTATIASGQQ